MIKVPDELEVTIRSRRVMVEGSRGVSQQGFQHLQVSITMPSKKITLDKEDRLASSRSWLPLELSVCTLRKYVKGIQNTQRLRCAFTRVQGVSSEEGTEKDLWEKWTGWQLSGCCLGFWSLTLVNVGGRNPLLLLGCRRMGLGHMGIVWPGWPPSGLPLWVERTLNTMTQMFPPNVHADSVLLKTTKWTATI